jgi:hypothetical protein
MTYGATMTSPKTMPQPTYDRNHDLFDRLERLLGDIDGLHLADARSYKSKESLDLHVDILDTASRGGQLLSARIALSHYARHESGDMLADPDMEINVQYVTRQAFARTFQHDLTNVRFDSRSKPGLQQELDDVLLEWLKEIEKRGYTLDQPSQ